MIISAYQLKEILQQEVFVTQCHLHLKLGMDHVYKEMVMQSMKLKFILQLLVLQLKLVNLLVKQKGQIVQTTSFNPVVMSVSWLT